MYEERKSKLDINVKSLIIKLGLVLLIAFIICFIIFRPKNNKETISLSNSINNVKDAAIMYFKENMTIKNIGEHEKITLEDLEKNNYINKETDLNNYSCNVKNSYAYLLKTRDNEFILKVELNCENTTEAKRFNLKTSDFKSTVIDEIVEDEKNEKPKEEVTPEKEEEKQEIKPPIKEEKPNKENNNKKPEKENNSIHIDFGNDKLIEELKDPNNKKKIRYKHIKYGNWTEGNSDSQYVEKQEKEVIYYTYCLDGNCVIDKIDNILKYENYEATYSHTEKVPMYRYVYTIWSTSCCIKGFTNTGIVEYR